MAASAIAAARHHHRGSETTMPLDKVSAKELNRRPKGRPRRDYVDFLSGLRSGDGGRTTTEREKATKQTVKNRLNTAAAHAGVKIFYKRTPPNEVVFWIER
jgi:hypothetical protein